MRELEGETKPYAPYYGRGLIHLTFRETYEEMGINYGVNLVSNPDLLATNEYLSVRASLRFVVQGKANYAIGKIKSPDEFYEARNVVSPMDGEEVRERIAGWGYGYYEIFERYCSNSALSLSGTCN